MCDVRLLARAIPCLHPCTNDRTPALSCGRSVVSKPMQTEPISYDLKLGLLRVSTSGSGTQVMSLYVLPLSVTPLVNGRL
jgi:hypothetical protein